MSIIKLAVGLGNSPEEYAKTRHNIGRIILSRYAEQKKAVFVANKYVGGQEAYIELFGKKLILLKLDGYMNNSGVNLKKALIFHKIKISECVVVYDDTAFDFGRIKISVGGSSGGHNGLNDIITQFGEGFVRMRAGIGAKPYKTMVLADYVLCKLPDSNLEKLPQLDDIASKSFDLMMSKGVEFAQNTINQNINKDEK